MTFALVTSAFAEEDAADEADEEAAELAELEPEEAEAPAAPEEALSAEAAATEVPFCMEATALEELEDELEEEDADEAA